MTYLTLNIITEDQTQWKEPDEFHTVVYVNHVEAGVRSIAIVPYPHTYGELACDRSGVIYKLRNGKWSVVIPNRHLQGYLNVATSIRGTTLNKQTHVLVAMTFIPNHGKKGVVDHINRIRSDNRVENLRWLTQRENCLTKGMYLIEDRAVPAPNRPEYIRVVNQIRTLIKNYYDEYPNYVDT